MSKLRVAVVQVAASLEPEENRARLDELVARAVAVRTPVNTSSTANTANTASTANTANTASTGHLVVLPEAYARDFGAPGSDVAPFAERLDGPFVTTAVEVAARHGVTIVAGLFEVSDDPARPYNTLVVVDGTGLVASYRKIHLYDSFGYRESDRLTAGPLDPVLVKIGGVRVGLMTCYDLRFPELARQLVDLGAELLVLPAAWVAGEWKVRHWQTLLAARAVENTVYVAAAAQPGPRYTGHSMVVDPRGEVHTEAGEADGEIGIAVVDQDVLAAVRAENPSLANRRL